MLARIIPAALFAASVASGAAVETRQTSQVVFCTDANNRGLCRGQPVVLNTCYNLDAISVDNAVTSFWSPYVCDYFDNQNCNASAGSFRLSGSNTDIPASSNSAFNDRISSFRCVSQA